MSIKHVYNLNNYKSLSRFNKSSKHFGQLKNEAKHPKTFKLLVITFGNNLKLTNSTQEQIG